MYVGVEMGGTKVVLATGTCPEDLTDPIRLPTLGPDETLAAIIGEIRRYEARFGELKGIGVASFGPIGITPTRSDYGFILKTPKPNWSDYNLIAPLQTAFPCVPIVLDTDVNGAAVGEARWGGALGLTDFAYVTIGTGIGVGIVSGGRTIHGLQHPEAGHIRVRHDFDKDPYRGRCPFHGDCLEGLASGPTLFDRTGIPGEDLPADHPVWGQIAEYLAELYMNITLMTSPQRILVGGGVGLNAAVMSSSRHLLHKSLGGYIPALSELSVMNSYLQPAHLGDRAGVLGALALALP